jgi:protein involved in ribonucleotide reduction
MSRFVGSVNVAFAPSPKVNLNASYSNFSTYTVIRSAFTNINQVVPTANLDTLNYTQISQNASMSASLGLGNNPNVMRMVIVNATYQQATDKQAGAIQDTGSRFVNANLAYTQQMGAIGTGFTLAFNSNFATAGDLKSSTIGPTAAVNKSLLKKKMQTSLTVSYNTQVINDQRNNNITNVRLTAGYRVSKHHNFNLSGIMLNKTSVVESSPDFTEYTVTLGYNYNF